MRDWYTNTEADAAEWDRHHLDARDYSDAPSRAEAEADLAQEQYYPAQSLEGISLEPPF